jgi:hypothetical protein
MTVNQKRKKRKNKNRGTRYLLATFSTAATLAIWSFFASQDQGSQAISSQQDSFTAPQNNSLQIEALPTLIPLLLPDGSTVVAEQNTVELRAVSAPPPISRGASNPMVVNNNGGSAPITTTASSG